MNKAIQYDPKNLVKQEKTYTVYQGPGSNLVLEFAGQGGKNGKVPGSYRTALRYFRLLQQRNLPSCFLDACEERGLFLVRPSRILGNGLEWIYRGVATGSFVERYGAYVKEGDPLLPLIESRLKDEDRGNPFIERQGLQALGILPLQAYESCLQLCSNIFALAASDMLALGLALREMRIELGLDAEGRILLNRAIEPEALCVYHGKNKVEDFEAFF